MNILNLVVIVATFVTAVISTEGGDRHVRRKRGLRDFCPMVEHTTGRRCTDFISYGNFCGLGGSGEPVDQLDYCCLLHDRCFHQVNQHCKTSRLAMFLSRYNWGIVPPRGEIMCLPDQHPCSLNHCECDREFSECAAIAIGAMPTMHPAMLTGSPELNPFEVYPAGLQGSYQVDPMDAQLHPMPVLLMDPVDIHPVALHNSPIVKPAKMNWKDLLMRLFL